MIDSNSTKNVFTTNRLSSIFHWLSCLSCRPAYYVANQVQAGLYSFLSKNSSKATVAPFPTFPCSVQ